MLTTIQNQTVFHTAFPELPMGKYAHIILNRQTDSFALFQTDGELNLAQVSRSTQDNTLVNRIVLFKRKQSTAERLTGRELLRQLGLIGADSAQKESYCEYNSESFCKKCPDCIIYGFAIGSQGSERSKVLVDSAFSLTPYDSSHQTMTFNAPFENGTMSQGGEMKSSINEQDHVMPQVFFPSVVTIKDPTEASFLYVLGNILRTKRYGAQNTRTGSVDNQVLGVVFANGEIFSNLKFTQALTTALQAAGQYEPTLQSAAIQSAAARVLPALLAEDHLVYELYSGAPLAALLGEVRAIYNDAASLRTLGQLASQQALQYAKQFGVLKEGKKPKGGK